MWLAWLVNIWNLEPQKKTFSFPFDTSWGMEKLQASHRLGVAGHKGATSARICHHLIRQQHGHVEFFTHLYGGTSSGGQDPKNIIWSILNIFWTQKHHSIISTLQDMDQEQKSLKCEEKTPSDFHRVVHVFFLNWGNRNPAFCNLFMTLANFCCRSANSPRPL